MIKVILIWDHRSFKSLHEIWFLLHSWRTKDFKLRCCYFFPSLFRKKNKKEDNLEFNMQLRFCFTFVHVIFNHMHGAKRYRGKKEKEK